MWLTNYYLNLILKLLNFKDPLFEVNHIIDKFNFISLIENN